MRIIIFLLVIAFIPKPVICQQPSKKEMQSQMLEAVNEINKQIADLEKQIADAKKNKEDEETIKDLEDQLAMLKKQVAMMGGVNKSISGISEKTFQQAGEEEAIVPKKDVTRINMLPKKILTDAELVLFIKNVHTEVEKIIPATEKAEALKIYNETKTENKSPTAIGSAASGCWMYGHQEKALWLMGKACIDNSGNTDNLNNYAAFLSMMGGEQAAIPILLNLNNKFPNNTSILNNLGQAWFGLGDIAVAKKYLESTTELYSTHSMANVTLSKIYLAQSDTPRAIAALKRSINESYSTEKEGSLTGIGGILTTNDLPEFNYPVEKDPFGFERFFKIIPPYQNSLEDYAEAVARWGGFEKAIAEEKEISNAELEEDKKKLEEFQNKLIIDDAFRQKILNSFNSPAYILANRSLTLMVEEESAMLGKIKLFPYSKKTSLSFSMLLISDFNAGQISGKKKPISYHRAFKSFASILVVEYYRPLEEIEFERKTGLETIHKKYLPCDDANRRVNCPGDERQKCAEIDIVNQTFLTKAKARMTVASNKMDDAYDEYRNELDLYIAMYYYGANSVEKFNKFFKDIAMGNELAEYTYTRSKLYNDFMNSFNSLVSGKKDFSDKCYERSQEKPAERTELPPRKTPDCPYEKELALVNGVAVIIECGRITFSETKLKNLKSGETKGSAITSDQQSPAYNPDVLRGPSFFSGNLNDFENFLIEEEPLFPGQEDNSALYIEYDKYGNLTDFKMKLNKDGTGLADSDPKRNGLESRWIWIATSSGREQKLSGLLKK